MIWLFAETHVRLGSNPISSEPSLDCFRESLVIHWTVGLLNRPQRKPLSRTESGILKVNKINPAIVTSTDQRFVVSKNEGGERASIFPGLNSNDHVILVDQLMGGDNFCGNGGHSRHFRRNKSRPIEPASPILFSIG